MVRCGGGTVLCAKEMTGIIRNNNIMAGALSCWAADRNNLQLIRKSRDREREKGGHGVREKGREREKRGDTE